MSRTHASPPEGSREPIHGTSKGPLASQRAQPATHAPPVVAASAEPVDPQARLRRAELLGHRVTPGMVQPTPRAERTVGEAAAPSHQPPGKLPLQGKGVRIGGGPGLERSIGHDPAHATLRRALSYVTPATKTQLDTDVAANTKDVGRFTKGEILTSSEDGASDTSAFTDANDSDLMNVQNLKWGRRVLGTLRPIGTGLDPGVKMHLVNSYFHTNANTWAENWVWGPGSLNKGHVNKIEIPAYDKHPVKKEKLASGKPIYALSYRTEVASKAAPAAKGATDLADDIAAGANQYRPMGYTGIAGTRIEAKVKVGPNQLSPAAYLARWQAAVGNTVAKKVTAFARIYGVDATADTAEGEDVALASAEEAAAVDYQVVVADMGDWFAANNFFTAPAAATPRRTRARTS